MPDETHDYRALVTLLLEDVTEDEARRFFAEGHELQEADQRRPLVASIESLTSWEQAS